MRRRGGELRRPETGLPEPRRSSSPVLYLSRTLVYPVFRKIHDSSKECHCQGALSPLSIHGTRVSGLISSFRFQVTVHLQSSSLTSEQCGDRPVPFRLSFFNRVSWLPFSERGASCKISSVLVNYFVGIHMANTPQTPCPQLWCVS